MATGRCGISSRRRSARCRQRQRKRPRSRSSSGTRAIPSRSTRRSAGCAAARPRSWRRWCRPGRPADRTAAARAAVTMLAATIVRGGQDGAVQNIFSWVADENRASWQRSALLRGAEIALLGAAMPGSPTGRRGGRGGRRVAVSDLSRRTSGSGRRVRIRAPTAPPRGRCRWPRGRTGPAAEPRARGAFRVGGCRWRSRTARGQSACARGVARQAGRGGADRALDGGRAVAFQRRAGGVQEHLPGLPSAGRARSGAGSRPASSARRLCSGPPRFRRASSCTARRAASA